MENSLMVYFNKRLKDEKPSFDSNFTTAGPVVTISREVGCNGLKFAKLLAAKFNTSTHFQEWKVLSKEIFYKSARELNLAPERVQKVFKQTDKYTFEQILKAFSDKNFKSERRIIKTVVDVVHSFAIDGHCIIVGRAGHIIAKEIENALHIRLIAPFDYRLRNIMRNNDLDREKATLFLQQIEEERVAFRKTIQGNTSEREFFDLTINRATFTDDELIELVTLAAQKKGMLKSRKTQTQYY